jgi:nucleotide-binding universal stress UspA family protein
VTSKQHNAPQPIAGVISGIDLHHDAPAVLGAAAAVARLAGVPLHLIHVMRSDPENDQRRGVAQSAADSAVEEVRRRFRTLADSLGEDVPDLASVTAIRSPSPHAAIVQAARATGADLIVVGSHATATASPIGLGSTADRVLRSAPVPCLVVRGEPRLPLRRAVVLTDFSPRSRTGLLLALAWLPAWGLAESGPLEVVHVAWPQGAEDDEPVPDLIARKVDRAIASCVASRPDWVKPRVLFGARPGQTVADYARDEGVDLLVVATHGHGALVRALIGSVTLELLHMAPCPVLAIPPVRPRR